MGMKLMSPFVSRDKQQEEQTRKILRIQEIEDLSKKANAKLANVEADFANSLAKNREKWAIEVEEKQKMMEEMDQEIKKLEDRKIQALIPVELDKKRILKELKDSKVTFERLKKKEITVDKLSDILGQKLTDCEDREHLIEIEEQKQKIARQGIESQQNTTKLGAEKLSKEIIAFNEKQKLEDSLLLERKNKISIIEINFEAKLDKYIRDLDALKIWETQLKDERAILERAFERLKKH
jgi:hypothetical protein